MGKQLKASQIVVGNRFPGNRVIRDDHALDAVIEEQRYDAELVRPEALGQFARHKRVFAAVLYEIRLLFDCRARRNILSVRKRKPKIHRNVVDTHMAGRDLALISDEDFVERYPTPT